MICPPERACPDGEEHRHEAAAATVPDLLRGTYDSPTRGVRRDMPLTNAIRQAFDSGTRDFTGRPGPNYWQMNVDYDIDVRLDPGTHTLTGSETITIHNTSPDALSGIVLRLDHNIFRGLVPRGSSVPAENTDGMVITRMSVNGRTVNLDPAPQRRGQAPQPGASGLDQTVASVQLDRPIPARTDATVEIEWHTELPGGEMGRGHRMTQRWGDTLFQPTQWFPRIAKYDDLRGWNTDVYLGPAEFFNNFGRFDVSIDVPAGWIVSGTGELQNPEQVLTATARERLGRVLDFDEEIMIVTSDEVGPGAATAAGDRLVWHYVAEEANDFAWATAEKFNWRATRATIPGKGPVPIRMVYLPDRADRFERAGALTRHALEFYSDLWDPYPFPQLTLQDGPSAGMEYPMVINSNQGAADHEAAHQWWPMMVGTNETWYGWMDEGFNSYMNILSGADARGAAPNLEGRGQSYGRTSGNEQEPPLMWAANYGGSMYGFQTYQKVPLMLSMLGGMFSDEAVQGAISDYTHEWAFKHPSPWDFAFFMSNALGEDLGWFWNSWLFTTASVDGSIEDVVRADGRTTLTVRQDGQMPAPVVVDVEYVSEISELGARSSAGVPLGATFETIDAHTERITYPVSIWFDGGRTVDVVLPVDPTGIAKITLDPNGRFPDKDLTDNEWPRMRPAGERR